MLDMFVYVYKYICMNIYMYIHMHIHVRTVIIHDLCHGPAVLMGN